MPTTPAAQPPTFAIPLWQGSSVADADRIEAGTHMVLDALGDDHESLSVPALPRGSAAVEAVRLALASTLAELDQTQPIRIVGGDCSADLAALQRSLADPGVRVLWLDAHADANTPMSSPSGAPHGMVARTALAEAPDRLVYLGVRTTDLEEQRWIDANGIRVLPHDAAAPQVLDALAGATAVHLHLDLDVLDPMRFHSVDFPEPHGVRPDHLVALIGAIRAEHELRCTSIMECSAAPKQKQRTADQAVLAAIAEALS